MKYQMVRLKLIIALILLSASTVHAQRVSLACAMESMPNTNVECNGWGFPFVVPANTWFCTTDHVLQNKFPYDPPAYGTNMRSMYFQLPGLTVPAHHAQISLITPLAYPPGTNYSGSINNSMSEQQNVIGIVTGFLSPNSECKVRAQLKSIANLAGQWTSTWPGGSEVETVYHIGIVVTVISPSAGMASGTAIGSTLKIPKWNITGTISQDGKTVTWAHGPIWNR